MEGGTRSRAGASGGVCLPTSSLSLVQNFPHLGVGALREGTAGPALQGLCPFSRTLAGMTRMMSREETQGWEGGSAFVTGVRTGWPSGCWGHPGFRVPLPHTFQASLTTALGSPSLSFPLCKTGIPISHFISSKMQNFPTFQSL